MASGLWLFLVTALLLGLLVVRHKPALLVHLAVGQGVLLALVGVFTALVLDTDWRTYQLEHASVGILEVARIGLGYCIDLVAVNHDDRRVRATQVGIAKLDTTPRYHRRCMLAHGIFENLRQAACGPAGYSRRERSLDRLVQITDAGTMHGGNEVDVGEVDEEQPALQLGLHVIALAGLHAVPLVQRNHQRAAAVEYEAQQVQVVLDHALAGIHDEDHHVGVLDRLQRLDHGEFFHRLEDLAATAHARGIDQGVLFITALERNVDAVAGGASLVVHNDALFAKHAVDQRRLADVGTADDGDLDAILLAWTGNALELFAFSDPGALVFLLACLLRGVVFRKAPQDLVEHVTDAATVSGSDGQRFTKPQRTELGAGDVRIDAIDLVHHQEMTLVHLAQMLGDHLITRRHTGTGVDDKHHRISFFHGLQRLLGHLGIDSLFVARQASGIDDDIGPPLPLGFTILAITGQTGV